MSSEESDTEVITDETETESEAVADDVGESGTDALTEDTETGTELTSTTETFDTTEGTTEDVSTPDIIREEPRTSHLTREDILRQEGRHIKAEDSEWAASPIPPLSSIVVENISQIQGCDLKKILSNTTLDQRSRILEILPLDLPLNVTLPLLEDGTYWKRMCLKSWPACDIWRYSDNWKSMFVHRTIQEMVQNFNPDENDISEVSETFKIFTHYVTILQILKLMKTVEKEVQVDLSSENFDEHLDDIIAAPEKQIYIDFEKVLTCFERLKEFSIILSPKYIDYENFHFSNVDFNSLLRGLRKLVNLEKFRISNGIFTNEQTIVTVKLFLTHECLTELNLSYNFVENNVCNYLAKLLISNCPLESLILKYNKITDEGIKSIAAALSKNSKLRKLDVSLNMIENEGGCFLAKVLSSNSLITYLDVSKNKMASKAGIAFAALIEKSNILRSLKIQENFLGEVAGKLISKSIVNNFVILELDVHYCGFRNEDSDLIHRTILRNRSTVSYSTYIKNNKKATASHFLF